MLHNVGKLGWEKGFVWNPDERNARRVKKTRRKEFNQKIFFGGRSGPRNRILCELVPYG